MTDNLARLACAAERIADALEILTEARRDPLALALVEAFGASPFTASDVMAQATSQTARAASLGQAAPPLPAALDTAGIRNAHALSRRLPSLGARQIGREGSGCIWCF